MVSKAYPFYIQFTIATSKLPQYRIVAIYFLLSRAFYGLLQAFFLGYDNIVVLERFLRLADYRPQSQYSFRISLQYLRQSSGYIRETGQNNSILVNSLIKSLSPKLKTSLIDVDLLGALNACVNVINKRYNNILRLIPKPIS